MTKKTKKKIPNKFHLGIQIKYRTLMTPSGKEYKRSKIKRDTQRASKEDI